MTHKYHKPKASTGLFPDVPQISWFRSYVSLGQTQESWFWPRLCSRFGILLGTTLTQKTTKNKFGKTGPLAKLVFVVFDKSLPPSLHGKSVVEGGVPLALVNPLAADHRFFVFLVYCAVDWSEMLVQTIIDCAYSMGFKVSWDPRTEGLLGSPGCWMLYAHLR